MDLQNSDMDKPPTQMLIFNHQCGNCEFSTSSYLDLLKHSRNCTITVVVDQYDEYVEKNGVIRLKADWEKLEQTSSGKYGCDSKMEENVDSNKTSDSWKCLHCDFASESPSKWSEHMSEAHSITTIQKSRSEDLKKRQFSCQYCEFKASKKHFLYAHIINHHTPVDAITWYKCNHCLFKSKDYRLLQNHKDTRHPRKVQNKISTEMKHGGQRVQCEHCDFIAKEKGALKRHCYYTHPVLEDRLQWYRCGQCNFKARDTVSVLQHYLLSHDES